MFRPGDPPAEPPAEDAAPPARPTALAPLHSRLFALLLDYLFIVIALNVGQQLALGESWDLRPYAQFRTFGAVYWGVGIVVLFLLKDAVRGRSLGKWLAGVAVRDAADPRLVPPRTRLALRNVLLLLLPVEAAMVYLERYGRRLGDKVAGTVVVVPERVLPLPRRLLLMASLVMAVLLAAFLVGPWNMRRTAAYRAGLEAIAADSQVDVRTGGSAQIDESPQFDLELTPAGGTARLRFEATGNSGTVKGEVTLELDRAARRWNVEGVELAPPEPEDTPGSTDAPLVEDAPTPARE